MRVPWSQSFLPVALLVVSSAVANAMVSTAERSSARAPEIAIEVVSESSSVLDSLREDVARHPNDFVTFETETAALRFIDEHALEAYRETEHRIIDRGVLGYWRGKALVVLPTLSRSMRPGV